MCALWLGVVAVASSGINVNPTSARYAATTATGVRSTVTLEASFTGSVNGVRNYAVPVEMPSSTLGTLARGALKRGFAAYNAYLMVKGIVDAAGWAIDELKNQVVAPATAQTLQPGSKAWCATVGGEMRCTTTTGGAIAIAGLQFQNCTSAEFESPDNYLIVSCRNGNDRLALAKTVTQQAVVNYGSGTTSDTVIDDGQIGDLMKKSPEVVNAILIDPDTGAPIRTQEITDAMNALRKQLEAANGVDPGPDSVPTDDPSKTQPMESQWPTFCSWAGKVCDFVDWMRSDGEPEKELPERDIEINPNSWSSGIGGGSCPAPETFTVNVAGSSGQGEFSWQPLCDFSTLLRPFLIVVASIAAAMILAGLRSGASK
ncbi:virulence factor TspB C-terminal domain-related protein [Xanthomonas sp. LMG 12461]|uniref:virulence factor TspB C-terminal domain-related protein n=1 Tax=Xanthomonas sp. LMG 12461 TaxID=2014543 RepID=UPI001D05971B|nr:virulence factor TspB C-terminal domain-related protein [Xanthomonas sp. LMG 12461]